MRLFYALGGGAGHLSRTQKLMRHLNINQSECLILHSCQQIFNSYFPNSKGIYFDSESFPTPTELKKAIEKVIFKYKPTHFYIDVFPFGLFGELKGINFSGEYHLTARILKKEYFKKFGDLSTIRFNRTRVIEALPQFQRKFIYTNSEIVEGWECKSEEVFNDKLPISNNEKWLILHTGSIDECNDLIALAKETANVERKTIKLFFAGNNMVNSPEISNIHFTTARQYFLDADRIITACGFNLMDELKQHSHKHIYIPFERKYDDQFERARLYREATQNL